LAQQLGEAAIDGHGILPASGTSANLTRTLPEVTAELDGDRVWLGLPLRLLANRVVEIRDPPPKLAVPCCNLLLQSIG
jgi:hypothetical protein